MCGTALALRLALDGAPRRNAKNDPRWDPVPVTNSSQLFTATIENEVIRGVLGSAYGAKYAHAYAT